MELKKIHDVVREMEKDDEMGETTISEYVTLNMRKDINKTEAYLNSKHTSGETDYMGRDKPFFNIVVAARNIWYRATDIDRKDITVTAGKKRDTIKAFLATILLQQWMKTAKFGKFLNDWGLTLATHGSAVTKFIEQDGDLVPRVIDWNVLLCDPIDFNSNIKIEKLMFTPAQILKQEGYDKDLVEKLLDNLQTRQTIDGDKVDNKSNYILVYELHGELPLSYLTDKEEDEDTYVQQMHILSSTEKKDGSERSGFDDYTLFSGKEKKDPYMISHLIEKDGQTYAGGAVKNLFESQWMVNHSEKMIKDHLDLGSKMLFQTSDSSIAGQNALTNIENGQIILHAANQPLTQLNNSPDIGGMQAFKADWQNIANRINGISEAMAGEAPKAGTAWRQTAAILQESHSLFDLMTENKGLAVIDMLTEYIIPYFKKKLNNSKEIAAILEDHQIKEFDQMYLPNEAIRRMNKKKKDTILSGEIFDPSEEPLNIEQLTADIQGDLQGNKRFIQVEDIDSSTWKSILKGLEWDLDIDVTGEAKDVQGTLATLSNILQTIAGNPAILQDPNAKMIFDKILGMTGSVSPIELQANKPQPSPQPALVGAPGGGGQPPNLPPQAQPVPNQ